MKIMYLININWPQFVYVKDVYKKNIPCNRVKPGMFMKWKILIKMTLYYVRTEEKTKAETWGHKYICD